MKLYSTYKHPKGWWFIVEKDLGGFHLYGYSDQESFLADTKNDYCQEHEWEGLQDTLDIAKQQAFEDFGVPLDSWVEVAEGGLESQA